MTGRPVPQTGRCTLWCQVEEGLLLVIACLRHEMRVASSSKGATCPIPHPSMKASLVMPLTLDYFLPASDQDAPSATLFLITFLSILPTLVLGIWSTMTKVSGMPHLEMSPSCTNFSRNLRRSVDKRVSACSDFGTTIASGLSPHFSSGTPTTATSETASCWLIRLSRYNEEIHSPPVLMTSFKRSVICT